MIQKTKQWLINPKRDYREGLEIFNQYASAEIKTKYGAFLQLKEGESINPFDKRFGILVNKVSAILAKMNLNPKDYPVLGKSGKLVATVQVDDLKKEISEKSEMINDLEKEKTELKSKIEELKTEGDDKQEEIDELTLAIEDKDGEIESLQTELEEKIKQSGLKVVKYDDLPKDTKKLFDRTKEIVPLIAKIHSELSNEKLTDDERKKLAAELCSLDDERRSIWDKIDAWAEGKDVMLSEPKALEYSDDPVVRGMQVGKRIERLKENIKRTENAIKVHTSTKKLNLAEKAKIRLDAYKSELEELEKAVDAKE
jgi:chromosome segregation ATPase